MLYLTCTMITSVDVAYYGVSHAKDWVSVDCGTKNLQCFSFSLHSRTHFCTVKPGRVAQSVGHLTRKSGVLGRYPVWQHTFVSPSAFSRRAVVSYWRKYVHEVLVNRLGGLSLPRKSVVRLLTVPT